eukprot:COSAG02_NODE_1707_length_11230_cov_3.141946_9_plen_86_part_00
MASDAPLVAAEVFPQVWLPVQGSRMMLTEDKTHNYTIGQFYVTPALILLAGIYGHFFNDWSVLCLAHYKLPVFVLTLSTPCRCAS